MKLIVTGASGFVGTEIIRQCLSISKITSVIAIARHPVSVPQGLGSGANTSKLRSLVLKDYDSYPDDVTKQLAGADACIWTVAITPTKSSGYEFEEVRRVCHDLTLKGLETVFQARREGENATAFRFLYMSGAASERDQSKTPTWKPEYCLMRGETENKVLSFAATHKGAVETSVAKPGIILAPNKSLRTLGTNVLSYTMSVPSVSLAECAAAMIHEVINGFTKEPLENDDLVEIGRQALENAE